MKQLDSVMCKNHTRVIGFEDMKASYRAAMSDSMKGAFRGKQCSLIATEEDSMLKMLVTWGEQQEKQQL